MSEEETADELARGILESITDAFFSLDRDFRFTYLNRTAQALLRRDDLVGKQIWEEFPAGRGTQFERAYERAMHRSEPVDFVEYYPAPLDRWYQVRAYPAPTGVSVYFQDITERRLVEAEVQRSREQMELVVKGAEVGVWYCPLPFDELIWDAKVKEHFFLPPDARVTIDDFYARLHPDDREATRAAIAASIENRTTYDIDYRTCSPDGHHTKWIRAVGRTFYAADGSPLRFDGVTIDVSRQKTAESAERDARAEAERQSRMKDEFLTTLSHELRTPLNAILGWAQLAVREPHELDPQVASKALTVIVRNAQAQASMVDDLLEMSRMLLGKVSLDMQRLAVAPLVAGALDTARPTAALKGVRLVVDPVPDELAVMGDGSRLQQVLWNLLSNAIKFTPKGGEVRLSVATDGSEIVVTVRDDGEGITPEFLPHVFERFRQADASFTRRHGGLGLGLAIVKQVVELHGGRVSASSPGTGRGATFEVCFPRAEPMLVHALATPPDSVPSSDGHLNGRRILVVEDDDDARALLVELLTDRGALVVAAANATVALAASGLSRFDVLVTDIGLPDLDGYELLRRVRARGAENGGDVPAIAVTAYARNEDQVRALAAGFITHVAKPIDGEHLVALVGAAAVRAQTARSGRG